MATQEFLNGKSNQQSNIKCVTLEKGSKRKYTRKSPEKVTALMNHMINEQINEQSSEEKYEQKVNDLINSEGDIETRLVNQQLAYRLEKNKDVNLFLESIQPLGELYVQLQDDKTIIERVKDAMINTVNYTKIGQQEGKKSQIAGKLIDLSLMDDDNLCVIGFDINKKLPIEEIDKIRQNITNNMLPINVGLVKTAHGGLHAYCNRNSYRLPSNRNIKKATNEEYENEELVIMDLTRLLVYYEGETEDIYAIKGYDAICDTQVLYHKLDGTKTEEKSDETKESKPLTAKHIFKKYASKFVKKGCKFNSEDPKILTVFQGYKHKRLDTTDYECLQMKKSRAAIVLQGRQVTGKNRFTDVIAELTSRYSCSNITNIDEFTGRFNSVIENKLFAVLNEMMNYNDSKKCVATVTKSIISDLTIRINEKNQPRRTAENVMNIIYVTNADMPVQLDTDDRRHLFNPTLIPMTEAKKQLINVSRSPIDDVIMEHYEQFK
ncbi:MAG: hypothetical protein EZS28_016030 [Streblomastix strix]|uniref:NrS-1 polymerase-like helicase domain-containing protein n=1 Tax=Streblomastix strix TaxID=222440 RepID=A0A5J4W0H0_9EUKA|nr:MAG: hypothetical protein EZS28_016030 [Streblomastix strix]